MTAGNQPSVKWTCGGCGSPLMGVVPPRRTFCCGAQAVRRQPSVKPEG